MISNQKPWIDALSYCAANGRKLISIQSQAKKLELETYLPSLIGAGICIRYIFIHLLFNLPIEIQI